VFPVTRRFFRKKNGARRKMPNKIKKSNIFGFFPKKFLLKKSFPLITLSPNWGISGEKWSSGVVAKSKNAVLQSQNER